MLYVIIIIIIMIYNNNNNNKYDNVVNKMYDYIQKLCLKLIIIVIELPHTFQQYLKKSQ